MALQGRRADTEPLPGVRARDAGHGGLLWLLVALPLVVVGAGTAWIGLGVDVQYVLGGLITAGAGGAGGPLDVFVHRPLVYRLLLAGLQGGANLVSPRPAGLTAQLMVRMETYLLVLAVGTGLWWGLRRHLPETASRLTGLAAAASLCLAPNFHFLTADWVGVVTATGAIGAALGPRRPWLGALLGGLLVWVTIAVKVATLPWALLAVGVVAVLTVSRAVATAGVATVVSGAWLALTAWLDPLELTWLRDSVRAVHTSPLQTGFGVDEMGELARVTANLAIVSPIIVALPAAVIVTVVTASRYRWPVRTGVTIAAVALAFASGIGQGEWYAYHFAGLPVLAAGVWAYAVGVSSTRLRVVLVVGPTIAGALSVVLLGRDLEWRRQVFLPVIGIYTLVATAVVAVVLGLCRCRGHGPGPPATMLVAASTALALCLLAAGLPASGYAFDGFNDRYTNASLYANQREAAAAYARVRAEIGPDTPVLYLAYGSRAYLLGNPTPCRYASPVFVARSAHDDRIRMLASYRDNLSCYDDRSPARYLVVDRAWADVNLLEPALRDRLNSLFDCAQALRVEAGGTTLEFCPRVR